MASFWNRLYTVAKGLIARRVPRGGHNEESFVMQVVTLLHGKNVRQIDLDLRRRVRDDA